MKLGLIGKLSDIHQAQEVSFQFVHLVYYIGIERKNLKERKERNEGRLLEQLKCTATHADRIFEGWQCT